ncbi:MAG: gamma-glutamyl-gamma-aminobutyrate hydrolase family protein [Anaerolineales bacterium]|nr:gamma-glutamyl-gamma-aminobutyrate hydrolase family protein [Anaerolineales bacterium]
MTKPLIGITTSRTTSEFGYPQFALPETYVQALVQTGANPVLIPSDLPEDVLRGLVLRLDGILFSGGGDIEPHHYNAEIHPSLSYLDSERDRGEFFLLEKILQRGMPFLAICRGIQVLNVSLGGTLFIDIPSQIPGALKHSYSPAEIPIDFLAHEVQVEPGSRLAEIVGASTVDVNSTHHQAIKELAPGLKPVAYSPDELIEAVELSDYGFGLGVQWHPERLVSHTPMAALFHAFVEAADSSQN